MHIPVVSADGCDRQRCAGRKSHPCRYGSVLVLVEDAAEAVAPVYVEADVDVRRGDR